MTDRISRRAPLLAIALAVACASGIGGPTDKLHEEQRNVLRELSGAGGRNGKVVAVTSGKHHLGVAPGCSGNSEAGIGCEGAKAGDLYSVAISLVVDGITLTRDGQTLAAGAPLASFDRLASREAASSRGAAAKVDVCFSRDGGRLAATASFDGGRADWVVIDLAPGTPRWGVVDGAGRSCEQAANEAQPMVWNR